jgi:hypothetical protein
MMYGLLFSMRAVVVILFPCTQVKRIICSLNKLTWTYIFCPAFVSLVILRYNKKHHKAAEVGSYRDEQGQTMEMDS